MAPLLCLEEDDLCGMEDHPHGQPPPIYAMKFCPVAGSEHLLGMADEDGSIAVHDTNKVGFSSSVSLDYFSKKANRILRHFVRMFIV